ncbi:MULTISPECIES: hypothetical protein [Agrobacterium tumefaciens complex]|nr:hypothetical protein [Agrobacterium tumefaciens]MBP2536392.1 hypothetical protein [Agrobacterium tumefaciens]MDP9857626.1 hypothetical protein [Agrobacterium tumefaciens]
MLLLAPITERERDACGSYRRIALVAVGEDTRPVPPARCGVP